MNKLGQKYKLAGQSNALFTVIRQESFGSVVMLDHRFPGTTMRVPVSKLGYPYQKVRNKY
jgi:hypothetical protein